MCLSPRPLPPTPILHQTSTALHGFLRTWLVSLRTACRGRTRASRRERTREERGLARAACEHEQEAEPPPPAPFTAGRGERSPFSSGLRVERHRPRGRRGPRAKPSKLHLLRIRADSTCPIAHIPRAACSAPRRRSPQSLWGPAQLSSSGDLTTPGGLTLRTLNPGPHASWPRPSSRSHRRSSVGAGAG